MAYNLNYNPGTEYEKHMRRRRNLIILMSIIILLVVVILIWIGFKYKEGGERSIQNNASSTTGITKEQASALVKSMTGNGSSTLTTQQETRLIQNMTAKNQGAGGTTSKSTVSDKQKQDLIKAMSGK